MRIALINTFTPFTRGGAEILVDDLSDQLKQHGHEVVTYGLPFPQSIEVPLVTTIEAARMMCFDEYERVIAFKFPAYCVQHQAKVMWMFHQFRQVYDLWGTEHGLKPSALGNSIRNIVVSADNEDIPRSRHVFTNSYEVSRRLMRFNNLESKVLMPPLKNSEQYYCNSTGDYIFYPSRITPLKRQHLAVEAMCHVNSNVRLIVAGVVEGEMYLEQIKKIIRENGLEKRVELKNEWISDKEKQELIANSLGVFYIPYLEDSCGFVSMEAFYSRKPVICCTDSGGTSELIENNISGFEVEPTPQALALAIDRLYENKKMAESMGKAALEDITNRDITWPSTIKRLLE